MRRGNRFRLAQPQLEKIRRGRRPIHAFGLVGDDDDLLAELAQRLCDVVIRGLDTVADVNHEQHSIGFIDGAQCLLRHQLLDALRVDDQAAGIDDQVRNRSDFAVAVIAVARQAGKVRDQRIASAREEVEQRRFADVGSTD